MFVDASVLISLLAAEPGAVRLAQTLEDAKIRYTSGLVVLDTVAHLSKTLDVDPRVVETHVQSLLDEAHILLISITGGITTKAIAAFAAYGEGRDHPAQLSLADCLSYACAQAYRVPLFSTGRGFALTDVKLAP